MKQKQKAGGQRIRIGEENAAALDGRISLLLPTSPFRKNAPSAGQRKAADGYLQRRPSVTWFKKHLSKDEPYSHSIVPGGFEVTS
jgi:hypothetical protein